MSSAQRYPLSWPENWKRTPASDRTRAPFSRSTSQENVVEEWRGGEKVSVVRRTARTQPLNASDAADRLERQLEALGASDAILSTNQQLRIDGRPKSNLAEPSDPGAAVYFKLNGKPRVLACDKWLRIADNIAALAAHIDAMRRIDRYGVGTLDQAFTGYVGLPSKGQTWRTTLGFPPDAIVTKAEVDHAFRERARAAHPDADGGSHDAMASLTQARAEGLAELS
jgi:hypothetical protein